MSFTFTPCSISGVFEITPKIFGDARGYFFEFYNRNDFKAAGIDTVFVQDNESRSAGNVIRGLHFQKRFPQAKLVRVNSGKIFDVIVDLRLGSATFGKWFGIVLDSEKKNMLYFPEGFAHGFCVLSEEAIISYKCSDFYHPEDEGGLIWNDKSLDIKWESVVPDIQKLAVLSAKDLQLSSFSLENRYFDLYGKWIGA